MIYVIECFAYALFKSFIWVMILKKDMQVMFGLQSENLGIRPVLELSSCVNLGKSADLSEPQAPYLQNGGSNTCQPCHPEFC